MVLPLLWCVSILGHNVVIFGCICLAISTLWFCVALQISENNFIKIWLVFITLCTVTYNLLQFNHAGFLGWHYLDTLPDPQAGDILEFRRAYGLYSHFGIADGNGSVYHYSNPGHLKKSEVQWRNDSIGDVCSSGGLVRVNNSADKKMKPLESKEIIKLCKKELRSSKSQYNLLWNNCEHLVTKMRYGQAFSFQMHCMVFITFQALLIYCQLTSRVAIKAFKKQFGGWVWVLVNLPFLARD